LPILPLQNAREVTLLRIHEHWAAIGIEILEDGRNVNLDDGLLAAGREVSWEVAKGEVGARYGFGRRSAGEAAYEGLVGA
jgi:hypothetical protein